MENMKFKLELLSKEYNNELTTKNMFKHILKFGYVMIQVKKKFKNKKQIAANKRWQDSNREQFNLMKRTNAKLQYQNNELCRIKKQKYYNYNKEIKRLNSILI